MTAGPIAWPRVHVRRAARANDTSREKSPLPSVSGASARGSHLRAREPGGRARGRLCDPDGSADVNGVYQE